MRKIPLRLTSAFTGDIRQAGVAASDVNEYLKWLQYYLDFCDKYRQPHHSRDDGTQSSAGRESIPPIEKNLSSG